MPPAVLVGAASNATPRPSAAAMARKISNIVPAPMFQLIKSTAPQFDMRVTGIKLSPDCAISNILMGCACAVLRSTLIAEGPPSFDGPASAARTSDRKRDGHHVITPPPGGAHRKRSG